MSTYLPEKRTLFLHIPRTGGTWSKFVMQTIGVPVKKWHQVGPFYRPKKHTILPHYGVLCLSEVDRVVTFVRRPVEHLVSLWRFCFSMYKLKTEWYKNITNRISPRLVEEAIWRWKPDFDEWLEEMLEEEPAWNTRWIERYVGPDGGEFCHYIGRQETLEADLEEVLGLLGYGDLWRRNYHKVGRELGDRRIHRISEKKAPIVTVTDEQRRRVERAERAMLRRFYGEDTIDRRVYRNFKTGEPT